MDNVKEILFRNSAEPFHLTRLDIKSSMKSSRCSMRLLRELTWRTSTRNGDGLTDMYRKVVRV